MGFIRIETVIDVDNKFSCEIESEGLYTINCLPSTNHIKSLDKIHEICKSYRDMRLVNVIKYNGILYK